MEIYPPILNANGFFNNKSSVSVVGVPLFCITPNPQSSCCTLPRGEFLLLYKLSIQLFTPPFNTFQFLLHFTALLFIAQHFNALHFTMPYFFRTGRSRNPGTERRPRRRWFWWGCVKSRETVEHGKGKNIAVILNQVEATGPLHRGP